MIFGVTGPVGGADAITKKQGTTSTIEVKALLDADGDYLRSMVRAVVEATLESEMTAALGRRRGSATARGPIPGRSSPASACWRSGFLRTGTAGSRRGSSSVTSARRGAGEGAGEMYVQEVSTRKVKAITEELRGHSFSASAIGDVAFGGLIADKAFDVDWIVAEVDATRSW